jgi:uncharacterized protein (DUF2236 family)
MGIGFAKAGTAISKLPVVGGLQQRMMSPVVAALTADQMPDIQYTEPPGDPGLFGPDSVTWKVHADAAMLVGGIAALMQQTLHPLAMAGVAEHSDYRTDPLGRLGRTASFVTATTYGSTEVAERMFAIVRKVHTRINGTAPDGRPYSAEDPDLLTWVHITEVSNFLRAHQRYVPFPVRGADADRYFAETAVIAERLGATDVPGSRDEVDQYFRDIRPELVAGEQALETLDFLTTPTMAEVHPLLGIPHRIVIQAAIGLQPRWVKEMLGLRRMTALDWSIVRPAAFAMLSTARLAGGEAEPMVEARERCTKAA